MNNLVELFKQTFNKQIVKRNQSAVNEGIQIMREINILKIPTASTYERIDYTMNQVMEYINKWTA